MFLAPIPIVIMFLVVYALAGMAIGALTGWITSLMTRCTRQGILKDAFLGLFGFLAGFVGCIFMPWPRNTISYSLDGGGVATSTMNTYQHPERVAIVVAVLLPVLHELYRWRKRNSASFM